MPSEQGSRAHGALRGGGGCSASQRDQNCCTRALPEVAGKGLSLLTAVSGMAVFGLLMLKASTKQKICWEQVCPNSSKDVLSFTGIYP